MNRSRLPRTIAALGLLAGVVAAPASAEDVFTRLTDIRPGTSSGVPNLSAAVWNGDLYFVGTVANFDTRIFRYDGVNAPVEMAGTNVMPDELVVFDDEIYFRGGPFEDREVWHWDGVNPPSEAFDLLSGGSGSSPQDFVVFGSRLCFSAGTTLGYEAVCYDGTNPPLVLDVRPGPASSNADDLGVANGALYFSAYEEATGVEGHVWTGTGSATLLADLRPGTPSNSPEAWSALGADLHFTGSDTTGHRRLFRKLSGQAAEQDPLALDVQGTLGEVGGALFVSALEDGDSSPHVYRYDGVDATRLRPSAYFADSYRLHRGAVYFVAGVSSPYRDLYRWCGAESVELVTGLFAANSDNVGGGGLIEYDDRLFFAGHQSLTTGGELWVLDAMTAVFCQGFDGDGIGAWSDSAP